LDARTLQATRRRKKSYGLLVGYVDLVLANSVLISTSPFAIGKGAPDAGATTRRNSSEGEFDLNTKDCA
jgi:hypothetical protein